MAPPPTSSAGPTSYAVPPSADAADAPPSAVDPTTSTAAVASADAYTLFPAAAAPLSPESITICKN